MKTKCLLFAIAVLLITSSALCQPAAETFKPGWWGKPPGQKPTVRGVVANISPTNISVKTRDGLKSFTVNEKTRVVVRGEKATIADVKVGNPVLIRFRPVANSVPVAVGIIVPKPGVSGEIVSIQGNVIVVRETHKPERARINNDMPKPTGKKGTRGAVYGARQNTTEPVPGVERRIVVGPNTKYDSRGYKGSLEDLRVGYRIVRATGTMNGDGLVADFIEFIPAVAKGTVTAIDGGVITVKTVRQLTLRLQPSAGTVVWVKPRVAPDKKGSMDDVKVGSPVNVAFHPTEGAPAPVLWIAVFTGM